MIKSFEEIKIHHVTLVQINDVSFLDKHNFIVFWWKEIPLGHIWLTVEKDLSVQGFRSRVVKSITPAMEYYCRKSGADNERWKGYVERGEIEVLSSFLDKHVRLPEFFDPNGKPVNKISVIVCTRNRSASLKRCIEALIDSSDKDFELIIIDNAPSDSSTENLVKGYPSIRYVREKRKGLDIARNTGALNASYNVVAYTDDDVIVSKDWITKLKNCFSDPEVCCVTGLVFPCNLSAEPQYIFERFWSFNKGYVPLVYDQSYFNKHLAVGVPVWEIGAGANMAFRKEIFDLAGLFDERLDVGAAGCSGDSEMWYRILAGGWRCKYRPDLFVYHNHRETKEELRQQLYNYMRGFAAALLVQYEKFHHKGNLVRLYKTMPKWYINRFKRALKGKKEGFLFSEMKGYISGWRFYRSNRKTDKA